MRPGIFGGPGGARTHDLRVANAALSQLSYEPKCFIIIARLLLKSKSLW